jgi:hypothetical protein
MSKNASTWSPLFVTSTVRSGSTLLTHMLSAHKDLTVAADPAMPLFRALRNAVLTARGDLRLRPDEPFQDYYFTDERLAVLDAIQESSLEMAVDAATWRVLLESMRTRAGFECADLVPFLDRLAGPRFVDVFGNLLGLIAEARGGEGRKWVGFKDVWIIEFYALLARAFPGSRFVVLVRDPRAVAASNLGAASSDPEAVGHMLSYARHWRKYVAFTIHYLHDPALRGRLHFLRYEDLVREPRRELARLCDFLDVPFRGEMLDSSRYLNHAGGGWRGNSTFQPEISGIAVQPAERWREKLDVRVWKLVDMVCGADMRWAGYEPTHDEPDSDVLQYLLESEKLYANWRTDLRDAQKDFGYEGLRRSLLALPGGQAPDTQSVRRCFLFTEVYGELQRALAGETAPRKAHTS